MKRYQLLKEVRNLTNINGDYGGKIGHWSDKRKNYQRIKYRMWGRNIARLYAEDLRKAFDFLGAYGVTVKYHEVAFSGIYGMMVHHDIIIEIPYAEHP